MTDSLIVKIQYLYIEANELMAQKKYYAASTKLEEAEIIFNSITTDDSESRELRDKIRITLTAVLDYLNPIELPDVQLTDSDLLSDSSDSFELGFETSRGVNLEPSIIFINTLHGMAACFEPIFVLQRRISSYFASKTKQD